MSIYQQLLGLEFALLAPVLQHVHGPIPHVQARGAVTVTHGRGWMVKLLNRLSQVPPPASEVPLRLEIRRQADRETWIRHFGEKKLVTEQWIEGDHFMEKSGKVVLAMRLRMDGRCLYFHPVHARVVGIKVPRWMGITVHACVEGLEDGWKVSVETRSGLLGLMFRYAGKIELEA